MRTHPWKKKNCEVNKIILFFNRKLIEIENRITEKLCIFDGHSQRKKFHLFPILIQIQCEFFYRPSPKKNRKHYGLL